MLDYNPLTYIFLGVNDHQNVWVRMLSVSITWIIVMAVIAFFRLFIKSSKDNVNETSSKPKGENVDAPALQESPIVPISIFSAPEIKSQKRSQGIGHEIIQIEFVDGIEGSIYFRHSQNEYFFDSVNSKWTFCYYDNFNNSVNALYYYKKTGELLKVGYLYGYNK